MALNSAFTHRILATAFILLACNAAFSADIQATSMDVSVLVSGTAGKTPPEMGVVVDDMVVGSGTVTASYSKDEWQTLSVTLPVQKTPQNIGVRLLDDGGEKKQSAQKLYVQSITINGARLTPDQGMLVTADNVATTGQTAIPIQASLLWNTGALAAAAKAPSPSTVNSPAFNFFDEGQPAGGVTSFDSSSSGGGGGGGGHGDGGGGGASSGSGGASGSDASTASGTNNAVTSSAISTGSATVPVAPTSPDTSEAGYYSTSGNQIIDAATDAPVRLSCAGYLNHGYTIPVYIKGIANAGFNCVRLAWYDARMTTDLATADQVVAAATANGIKVILDHHGNEIPGPNNGYLPYPCNGLPFDTGPGTNGTDGCGDTGTISRQQYVDDWVTMVQHFAGNNTVIGVDLTNEPHWYAGGGPTHGGSTWGDGSVTDLQAIFTQAGNAIQAVSPNLLIIAQAINNFNPTFFSGAAKALPQAANDFTMVPTHPLVLQVPHKVVYSVHEYPNTISSAPIDSGTGKVQLLNVGWGFLETQNIAPVWIGEMGASLDGVGPDSVGIDSNGAAAKLADEQAWAAMMVAYLNGQSGSQGGPVFSGSQKGISTDWWAWGNLEGETPDGTLDTTQNARPAQQAVYLQLR